MKRPVIALASSLVFVAGCSGQSQNQAQPEQSQVADREPRRRERTASSAAKPGFSFE